MTKQEYVHNYCGEYGPNCMCCGKPNTPYMVRHELWKQVAPPGRESKMVKKGEDWHRTEGTGRFVCILCFEDRLGRELTEDDFLESKPPINYGWLGFDCTVYTNLKRKAA